MLWKSASIQRLVGCYCCFENVVDAVEVSVYSSLGLQLLLILSLLLVLWKSASIQRLV